MNIPPEPEECLDTCISIANSSNWSLLYILFWTQVGYLPISFRPCCQSSNAHWLFLLAICTDFKFSDTTLKVQVGFLLLVSVKITQLLLTGFLYTCVFGVDIIIIIIIVSFILIRETFLYAILDDRRFRSLGHISCGLYLKQYFNKLRIHLMIAILK